MVNNTTVPHNNNIPNEIPRVAFGRAKCTQTLPLPRRGREVVSTGPSARGTTNQSMKRKMTVKKKQQLIQKQ